MVLAEHFELTEPTEWTVRLREGIRYSDNTPMEIEDVATALEMYRDAQGGFLATFFPEWPRSTRSTTAPSAWSTEKPLPILDYLMTNILITPAAENKPEELQTGVGSGPYVVTKPTAAPAPTGCAATPTTGAPPRRRQVQVRFLPEESSRVIALRSGEVDVIDSITPDSREQLAGLPGVDDRDPAWHPAEPDLLQLPQAVEPPAGRRPGPRGPQLCDQRRSPDQRRAA